MPISQAERRAIGLTLAGEIDPRMSPYSDPNTAVEAANILATIENRFQAKPFKDRVAVTKQPKQYSTWNKPESRAIAKANYAKYGPTIDGIVDGFYDGSLKPSVPDATHYYSPKAMAATQGKKAPGWAKSMKGVAQQGAHVFGTIDGPKKAKSLPDFGPVPSSAVAARGLLSGTAPVQSAGLLGPVGTAAPAALGLLGATPVTGAANALNAMASAPAARTIAPETAMPVQAQRAMPSPNIATPNAIAASPATQVASIAATARAAPNAGLLSSTQEANLADRLGSPEQALQGQPKIASPRLAPGTMLTANMMVAPTPVANIASPRAVAPQAPAAAPQLTGFDAEMAKREQTLAAGLAAQRATAPAVATRPVVATAPPVATAYAAENPAAAPAAQLPSLPAPRTVTTPRMASVPSAVPAAVQAAQPAPAPQSQPGLSAGLGAPSVPDAPGFGAQIASRIGNAFSQNKGRMVGGLLGSMVGGPVGGLLGGYIGNRVQQGNTPQMSNQARGAILDGNFDGFAHGPAKNAGLLGGLFGTGGLLGGGLGAPSMPSTPTGVRSYSVGGGGGASMSSAASAAMSSGGFDGFSHSGSTNSNTSKSSASKGSSKSSGGKKK